MPTAAATGYSLLDKMGVTSSEFQQSVTYKRALEGELASTISAMDGVKTAAVRLAIPEKTVFVSKTPDTTASVFVETAPGSTLSGDKVQAIVHLTSAAIENLKPANVSVVDSQGNVLSAVGGGAAGSASKQATDYQQRTSDAVKAVMDRVVGPGNSTVAVAADVTGESAQQKSETFTNAEGALPLSESSKTEKYTGTGGGAAGVLGPDNIAVPGDTSGNGSFDSSTETKNNAVNKVTEDRVIPAGAVKRQTISVAVDQAAAGGLNLASLTSLVTAAAGVDAARGDVVTVEVVPFSTAAADQAAASLEAAKAELEAQKQSAFFGTLITAGSILLGLLDSGPRHRHRPAPPAEARTGGPRRTPRPGDDAGDAHRHGAAPGTRDVGHPAHRPAADCAAAGPGGGRAPPLRDRQHGRLQPGESGRLPARPHG